MQGVSHPYYSAQSLGGRNTAVVDGRCIIIIINLMLKTKTNY